MDTIKAVQEYFFNQTGEKISLKLANNVLEYCQLCATFILFATDYNPKEIKHQYDLHRN